MIKKQRGSAAVLALVMLLFLALAGGAWVLMHAQDNATAMSDAKEQQAWYAAESGVKRAKAELENSNTVWKWLNTDKDKDFKNDDKFVPLDPDKKTADAKTAQYAVSITYPSGDTTIYLGENTGMVATAGTTTYTITSVGKYMETTKVIKEEVPVKISGSSDETQKPKLSGAMVTTAGNILFTNSTSEINGNVSASGTISDKTHGGSGGMLTPGQILDPYADSFLTKMPAELFEKNHYTYDGELKNINNQKTPAAVLEANKTYYWNTDTDYVSNNWIVITAGEGATLVIDGTKDVAYNSLVCPTSGKPLTIVFLNTQSNGILRGNINPNGARLRVLSPGNLTLDNNSNYSSSSKYMFLCNGNMIVNTPLDVAYLSANGTVTMWKPFKGQVFAKGDVTINNPMTVDTSVLDDPDFLLPAGMTAD